MGFLLLCRLSALTDPVFAEPVYDLDAVIRRNAESGGDGVRYDLDAVIRRNAKSGGDGLGYDLDAMIRLNSEGGDEGFDYDLRSMIRLNPDFSTYPSANGVIWLKRASYRAAPSGGLERRHLWVLLGREGLDSRWYSWNIPTPMGGKLEILEASAYSYPKGEKLGDAAQNGDAVHSVVFSELPGEFILVLSYKETFPDKLSIDDLVWFSESLPLWEGAVRVTAPFPFYHATNVADVAPEEREVGGYKTYEWRLINTPAEPRFSMRASERKYLAFASREGRDAAARALKAMEAAPAPPVTVQDMLRGGRKGVENLLQWFYKQPGLTLTGVREIPAEAPWTPREKLLLAHRWLKDTGVNARLFWRPVYRPGAGEPAYASVAVEPVLEVFGSSYCTMEQLPHLRETTASLQGSTVYGVTLDGRLEERKIPAPGATLNRLEANVSLTLGENGMINGRLRLTARGAWRHLLFPESPEDGGAAFLASLFPQGPRFRGVTRKELRDRYEITATLAETQAITDTRGDTILASMPRLIPSWLTELASGPSLFGVRFPFVLESKIALRLPPRVADVALPTPVERGSGKIRYSESFKLIKRRTVQAESRVTFGTASPGDEDAVGVRAVILGWQGFMTRQLPVRLARGKTQTQTQTKTPFSVIGLASWSR
jgi:hypothetical protein